MITTSFQSLVKVLVILGALRVRFTVELNLRSGEAIRHSVDLKGGQNE